MPGLCPLGATPAIPGVGQVYTQASPARAGGPEEPGGILSAPHLLFVSILLPTVLKCGCDSEAAPSRRRNRVSQRVRWHAGGGPRWGCRRVTLPRTSERSQLLGFPRARGRGRVTPRDPSRSPRQLGGTETRAGRMEKTLQGLWLLPRVHQDRSILLSPQAGS